MTAWKNWLSLIRRNKSSNKRPGSDKELRDLEKQIKYSFKDISLLDQALKHRSIIAETSDSRHDANERLEFLGDAVLDLVVSQILYERFRKANEGYLARMKSLVVSGRQLSSKARQMGLGEFVQLSVGESRNGGRTRRSILEDALEALIGAIYLDGGLEPATAFISLFVADDISSRLIRDKEENYKSLILEFAQARGEGAPSYRVNSEEGPDHAKVFTVEVMVGGETVGVGSGRSKKQAEQQAAKAASDHFNLKI